MTCYRCSCGRLIAGRDTELVIEWTEKHRRACHGEIEPLELIQVDDPDPLV